MAPRAIGAFFALAAAILFVVSVASSAWWSGHPTIQGRAITAKTVNVGLYGATGCNTGGDGSCEDVEIDSTVALVGYGELGAIALAMIFAFVCTVAAWRISDARKGLAGAAMFFTLIAGAGGGAFLLLGPGIDFEGVEVPIGWGTYVFAGAIGSSLLAGLITRKLEPEPLRLKSSATPLPLPPLDIREAVRSDHDGLRPAKGRTDLPGSPGQVGRDSGNAPLFEAAPQLRPLYEPAHVMPVPASPPLPAVGPTPLPMSVAEAIAHERQKSPSAPHHEQRTKPASVPPAASNDDSRPRTKTLPPPMMVPHGSPPPSPLAQTQQQPPPFAQQQPPPSPLPPTFAQQQPPPSPLAQQQPPPPPFAQTPPPPSFAPTQRPPRPQETPLFAPPPSPNVAPPAPPRPLPGVPPARPPMIPAATPRPPKPPGNTLIAPPAPPARRVPMPAKRSSQPDVERPETDIDDDADHETAVEIDVEAKAAAQMKMQVMKARSVSEMRTGPNAEINEPTEIGVEIPTPPPATEDDVAAPPAPATEEMAAQRGLTDQMPVQDAARTQPIAVQNELTDAPADVAGDTPIPMLERQSQATISTAPASLPPPRQTDSMRAGPTPACPQCESPMAWVEEHLRFYCKQCKMYF